jgi:hypothetical protein
MRILLATLAASFAAVAAADDLAVTPPSPSPLDTIRLRWTHVGCTNPNAIQVAQESNRISVTTDRTFVVDCGTVNGFFEEFTLGRLPSGEYDAQLVVNPPPGTLGPTQLIGPVHISVARLPPTGTAAPRDDYTDLWWNPSRSGEGLLVKQSSGRLFAVWAVYDTAGRATWYSLQPGSWSRSSSNVLSYSGPIYRTTGPVVGRLRSPRRCPSRPWARESSRPCPRDARDWTSPSTASPQRRRWSGCVSDHSMWPGRPVES